MAPTHPTQAPNAHVPWQISVDRGLKWEEAYTRSLELTGPHDGFYLSYKVGVPGGGPQAWGRGKGSRRRAAVWCPAWAPLTHMRSGDLHPGNGAGETSHTPPLPTQVRGNQPSCLLAEQNRGKFFTVYKPNIGRQSQQETFDSLCRKFHRVGVGRGRRAGRMPRPGAHGPYFFSRPHRRPSLARLLQPPNQPSLPSPAGSQDGAARCRLSWPEALGAAVSPLVHRKRGWAAHPGSSGRVSPGDGRGGQGALGDQLHLVPEALQPHCLVRAEAGWGWVPESQPHLAYPSPPPHGQSCPSLLGTSLRDGTHAPHRGGVPWGI